MSLLIESITFGLVVAFILLGLVGIIVPMIPGTLLIWLAVLVYVLGEGITAVGWTSFIIITLIAIATGTADIWMSLLGAKTGGASRRAMLLGLVGAVVGSFIFPLLGTVIGYGAGILLGEYQKAGDWEAAWKASIGGLTGWGLATGIQLGGGLLMLVIFVWQVLSA